jgi:glyoxylase-like metal-dependent hydrolase (beta-lactamase superfamily II)
MTAFGPKMSPYTELAPGLRRIVAPNPSMMTGPGTNTYLFGTDAIAVLDPGPIIESHLEYIEQKAAAPIRWILVTHTHPDHSPGAAVLADATGAELLGMVAPDGEHQDVTFAPHRLIADGDIIETDEFRLEAVHTPGHASNHLCFRHAGLNWVFTGDHVIDGSTVVINPPDGNMKHYLQSLERLRWLDCVAIAPGHGNVISDPERIIDWTIRHRLEREAKILAAVESTPDLTSMELVPKVYQDVDVKLYGWAERSLLAHLLKLEDDGIVTRDEQRWHR